MADCRHPPADWAGSELIAASCPIGRQGRGQATMALAATPPLCAVGGLWWWRSVGSRSITPVGWLWLVVLHSPAVVMGRRRVAVRRMATARRTAARRPVWRATGSGAGTLCGLWVRAHDPLLPDSYGASPRWPIFSRSAARCGAPPRGHEAGAARWVARMNWCLRWLTRVLSGRMWKLAVAAGGAPMFHVNHCANAVVAGVARASYTNAIARATMAAAIRHGDVSLVGVWRVAPRIQQGAASSRACQVCSSHTPASSRHRFEGQRHWEAACRDRRY
jgi:hypothetical protein